MQRAKAIRDESSAAGEAAGGDVSQAYDRWASQYDSQANATPDLDAQVVRAAPLNVSGSDVVELGCGTGKNTVWLAQRARSVTALDFSAGMLALAAERDYAMPVRFVLHDVRTPWPLPDASCDVVVGNLVLEHVQQLEPVFAEACRVLRPGGQLFVCELHPYRQLRGGQAHFVEVDTGVIVHVPAFVHSVSEYVNAGVACGFRVARLGEWSEQGAPDESQPRLLSVLFEMAPIERRSTHVTPL